MKIYGLTAMSPDAINGAGDWETYDEFTHSSELPYLEEKMPTYANKGETAYLYEMECAYPKGVVVLLLDHEFYGDDYLAFFTFKLLKEIVCI